MSVPSGMQPYKQEILVDIEVLSEREKGRYLTQSYDQSPITNIKFIKHKVITQNASKKFHYTKIADRLRTVSWTATKLVR